MKLKTKNTAQPQTNKNRKGSPYKVKAVFRQAYQVINKRRWSRWLSRTLLSFVLIFAVWLGSIYGFFLWYTHRHQSEPQQYGVTFIAGYARYYGLDAHETMLALRDELGFRRFRLVSYWSEIEKTPGTYDFSELDWQLAQVEQVGGEVSLAIGLRQPRWPECHYPERLKHQPKDIWYPQLKTYLKAVVERYKDSPVITSYQLENEHMLSVFGECTDFSRERLQEEFDLVKSIDPKTPVILSLANNYFGVPFRNPRPDQYGVSVYRRVFDSTVTNRYFKYPFPSWYYGGRAGMTELLTNRSSMLHELQAEPWAYKGITEVSIAEQDKTMSPAHLEEQLTYGDQSGFRTVDLWGGEWWYWRKTKLNDPSLWNVVKNHLDR